MLLRVDPMTPLDGDVLGNVHVCKPLADVAVFSPLVGPVVTSACLQTAQVCVHLHVDVRANVCTQFTGTSGRRGTALRAVESASTVTSAGEQGVCCVELLCCAFSCLGVIVE